MSINNQVFEINLGLLISWYLDTHGGYLKVYDILRDLKNCEIVSFTVDNETYQFKKLA